MKKLNLKTKKVANLKPNSLFEGLSDEVKTIKAYNRIEKKIQELTKSDHNHKTVKEYVSCAWCNKKRQLRENYIKSEGFTSSKQYLEWRKIMEIIINKQNIILR
jgi:hypothetical protein